MKMKQLKYGVPDEENPELDDNFYKNAVPFYDMFPQLKPQAKKPVKAAKPRPAAHRTLHAA